MLQIFEKRGGALSAASALGLVSVVVLAAALSSSPRVGPTGVGPIIFGTTPAQAVATDTHFVATQPSLGSFCYYLRPPVPAGLAFMVEHGTIRRAEVVTPAILTSDGFRVGDPTSKILQFFGKRARVGPDKYDPETQVVTIAAKGADTKYRAIIFRVKDGAVQAIFAGLLPQIEYVEGSS